MISDVDLIFKHMSYSRIFDSFASIEFNKIIGIMGLIITLEQI